MPPVAKYALLGVFAVTFTDHVTLGSLLVATLVGIYGIVNIVAGGKRWRELYDVEKEKVHNLDGENRDLVMERVELRQRVVQLEERPDQRAVLALMGELAVKEDAAGAQRVASVERTVREEFTKHEQRAQERHDEAVKVLQEIAATLREPGGNHERPVV